MSKFKRLIKSAFILTCLFAFTSEKPKTIHSFCATTLEGESFCFSKLKGKKILIVNTASKCGYTSQYKELEELYQKYKGQNFVVIGFPSNDFMNQEPGTNEEIAAFCQKNFGVSFLMMEKINVKGENIHPIYSFLTTSKMNDKSDSKVKWNFQKYLINEAGEVEHVYPSSTNPLDEKITKWIES